MKTTLTSVHGKRPVIKQYILDLVERRGLQPGDRLPSQNQLAERFGVTALTTQRAMAELAAEGVIHRLRGKGSFLGPGPGRTASRSMCLVLPETGLDQPEQNPTHWEYVDRLLRCCLQVAGQTRVFSTLCIPPGSDPDEQIQRFTPGTVAFFFFEVDEYGPLLERFRAREDLAAVVLGQAPPDAACLTLGYNRVQGRRLSVHHLVTLGYRKMCFMGSDVPWEKDDYEACCKALAEAGLPSGPRHIVFGNEQILPDAFVPAMRRALDQGCDVIITGTDVLGLHVIDYLHRERVMVPGDVGVMGYEGLPRATEHAPFLASVRPPYRALIEAAVTRIESGRQWAGQHIELPAEIVPGQTVVRRA